MKPYRNIPYLVIILCTISMAGCTKYLDKKSNTSFVVPSTLSDYQALLDNSETNNLVTPIYGESSADDYFLTDANYNVVQSAGLVPDYGAYIWQPMDYTQFPNDWSEAYNVVYKTNLCLNGLPNVERTVQNAQSWDLVKGSALFLRSYYFLHLAWTYAKAYDNNTAQTDLGIVLRTGTDYNEASVRSNVQQTYDKILVDTKEAVSLLPDIPPHVLRPSKVAAYGLLARTYLSMRIYDSAFRYAALCLSLKSDLLDFNNSSDVKITSTTPFAQFNKETIFYSEATRDFVLTARDFLALADTTLYKSYDTRDLRKTAFFTASGGYYQFNGSYSGSGQLFSGIATDEMLLTRAECYARAGDVNNALKDLNQLLIKRYQTGFFVPVTAATAADAVIIILNERRKELLRRTVRWMDVKRINKEGAGITLKRVVNGAAYTLPPNDNRYALPLPKDVVNQGIQQNSY